MQRFSVFHHNCNTSPTCPKLMPLFLTVIRGCKLQYWGISDCFLFCFVLFLFFVFCFLFFVFVFIFTFYFIYLFFLFKKKSKLCFISLVRLCGIFLNIFILFCIILFYFILFFIFVFVLFFFICFVFVLFCFCCCCCCCFFVVVLFCFFHLHWKTDLSCLISMQMLQKGQIVWNLYETHFQWLS